MKKRKKPLLALAALLLLYDLRQFTRRDAKRIRAARTPENGLPNIRIRNSSSVLTPVSKLAYAVYLRHFSSLKGELRGSCAGLVFEWEVHNVAFYCLRAAKLFGLDRPGLIESAREVDLGPTIYADAHPGAGKVMMALYTVSNPFSAVYDLCARRKCRPVSSEVCDSEGPRADKKWEKTDDKSPPAGVY